jgi:HAD superfamily hydrolase (TIGR01549 family)
MIRAVIFDLDNCLSAADEVGRELLEPTFASMRRANRGVLSDEALQRAFEDCWRLPLDQVAKDHGFSQEMLLSGWAVASHTEVRSAMCGYPDLETLAELPARLFLVTSGFRRLQRSKIEALRLRRFFEEIHIDAIDEPDRKGKQAIFERILDTHSLAPREVLVVGDNPDSEIAAGNRLGMKTVQILREGVTRGSNAAYHVEGLEELRDLLKG